MFGAPHMTRKRVLIAGGIVVVVLGVLAMPYLAPLRERSVLRCLKFKVSEGSLVLGGDGPPSDVWLVSLTLSNCGPDAVVLESGELGSRHKTGFEHWAVSLPSRHLEPGTVGPIAVRVPATGGTPSGPRVWEFHARYRCVEPSFLKSLRALHARLPSRLQVVGLAEPYSDDLFLEYPQNYKHVLTNELGWRRVGGRGLGRWGPSASVEAEPDAPHEPPPAGSARIPAQNEAHINVRPLEPTAP